MFGKPVVEGIGAATGARGELWRSMTQMQIVRGWPVPHVPLRSCDCDEIDA